MSELFRMGFELMGYGLVSVFSTLIAFIVMIWVMTKLLPVKEEQE